MADVFISYSRKDKDFVLRLHQALRERELDVWVDLEKIQPTEEFMEAIFRGIEEAQIFVTVLTPDWVRSVVGGREIKHATENNKRLVPIVARDVDPGVVPESLARLDWIFCRESDDFETALKELIEAIERDPKWLRAHTRLLTRTVEWEARQKDKDLLLRGVELQEAERWLAQAGAQKDPQPTQRQIDFISASREQASVERSEWLRTKLRGLARLLVPSCALIMFVAVWVNLFDLFGGLDTSIESYTMGLGSLFRTPQLSEQIAIVAITEDTERHFGKPLDKTWRREHAQLIDTLSRAGAKSIAFDVYLNEPGPYDDELITAMQSAKARGTAVIFGTQSGSSAVKDIEQAASGIGLLCAGEERGYATLSPVASSGKRKLLALSVLAVNQGGHFEEIDQENWQVRLRTPAGHSAQPIKYSTLQNLSSPQPKCPVLEKGDTIAQLVIDFSPLEQLRDPAQRYQYENILQDPNLRDRFSGKIVLVGQESKNDRKKVFIAFRGEERYGLEVQADMLNTLLRGTWIRPLGLWQQYFVMLVMGALGAAPRFYRRLASPGRRHWYLGAIVAAYTSIAIALYVNYGILLNMLYDLGTMFISYWALGKAARRFGQSDVPRSSAPGSALRALILLAFILAQTGCGSVTTVSDVQGSATVIHQGRASPAKRDQVLIAGDELRTGPGSAVILHFPTSNEVYVLPGTRVRIGSVFLFVGKVFVRAKGFFAVKTEFATAGVEGTEFWVGVDAKRSVGVGVLEGSVRLESPTGLWGPVRVTSNEVFRIPQKQQPPSEDPNPQDDLNRIRQLIQGIDKRRTRGSGGYVLPGVRAEVLEPFWPGYPRSGSTRPRPGSH
jgi:CHASE2 domain-containing sensor protein